MKIEKLTENKIRILINENEFNPGTFEKKELIFSTPEFKEFFLSALNKAEEEVNFNVDGCKLLIELFYQNNDTYIFTVTKYVEADINNDNSINNNLFNSSLKNYKRRYSPSKDKDLKFENILYIYNFNDLDDFCSFCNFIHNSNINLKGLFKSSILYFYNDTYYLIIKELNNSNKDLTSFKLALQEFSKCLKFTKEFELKLKEHGKIIIKNNAINIGSKYF